ncbi:Uncharacterised protein [Mycobacterium tuberculosis]|uniref:Uncharacterized protein n=1 Tax=Mycobacterium tuberculosis TaxID=1773 RepID=A0A0U0S760_MYCTX|nr:Uncharacterised protein [Mycobacterium tuberculosis]COW73064.1 Uncharacterised protein [Mycobacterium tuberculosis]COW80795.1 Uncharacterised protein [Mycobacterium tuberculosis]COW80914.1 Uncharacterised protein [Mycobacterium tuberculosis]COW99995.1 Uncharacterised protein [Mycobacterium tuberculosis]
MLGHIEHELVDHGAGRSRVDQRQTRDPIRDRNPQSDVHRGSPSAGYPTTSNVPASLHCDTVGSIGNSATAFAYDRSVTGFANSGTVTGQTRSAQPRVLRHCRVVGTETMFASEQRSRPGRVHPRHHRTDSAPTVLDSRGASWA